MQNKKKYKLIPYTCGLGAQKHGCKDGPSTLQSWGLQKRLETPNIHIQWSEGTAFKITEKIDNLIFKNSTFSKTQTKNAKNFPNVLHSCRQLYQEVIDCLTQECFPITIGGDHSMGIGTWSAIVDYFQAYENFGLLWIDAHLDAHTLDTSPSKAFHGMPIASLLGEGISHLNQLGSRRKKILGSHMVFIGARSWENEEYEILKAHNATIITAQEVHDIGFQEAFKKGMSIVEKAKNGFGISLDLDVFDPCIAPAVGSPEKGGLYQDIIASLQGLHQNTKLKAFEIAEYNPSLDIEMKTAHLVLSILKNFLDPS